MSEQELNDLYSRIEIAIPTIEDLGIQNELLLLGHRIELRKLPDEVIEQSVAELRETLNRPRTEQPQPFPINTSVDRFPGEEVEETEQSRFLSLLEQRIETGMIQFDEGGKPNKKAVDDTLLLFFQAEKAQERGILASPPPDRKRKPLTPEQTAYVDQLRHRITIASGHTGHRMPYEGSMRKIVREIGKQPNPQPQGQPPLAR